MLEDLVSFPKMLSIVKKIIANLPSYPHYKMNVYCGSNTYEEIKIAVKMLLGISKGENADDFLRELSSFLNADAIFTFAAGRMGLFSILRSIGIKPGEEVIIPAFTCAVVPNAIIYSGGKPVYCDVGFEDFNIEVAAIEMLITDKTRAIYAQHTFGQMCNVEKIKKIAKKFNLIVIEDVALALGAATNEGMAGTLGDFSLFSTDRSKVINTGLGGFVCVNNKKYLPAFSEFYKDLPAPGVRLQKRILFTFIVNLITMNPYCYWIGKFINTSLTFTNILTYFGDELKTSIPEDYPYPAKLGNIQATLGYHQIKGIRKNLEHRKTVARFYNSILNYYSEDYIDSAENIFLRYSFLVRNRDAWEEKFSSLIDTSVWFKTIACGRNDSWNEIFYEEGSCVNAECATSEIFNLPTHSKIKPEKLTKLLLELKNSGDLIFQGKEKK